MRRRKYKPYKLNKVDFEVLMALKDKGKHWTTIKPEHQQQLGTLQLHGYCTGIWGVDGLFRLTRRGARLLEVPKT